MILEIESQQLFNKLQYDHTASPAQNETRQHQLAIIDTAIEELRKEVGNV